MMPLVKKGIGTPAVAVETVPWQKPADRLILKRLVWLYFWLLIFEGALRKWFLPQLANPLLIVRDPVVVLIYLLAAQRGLMPKGSLLESFILLACGSLVLGIAQHLSGIVPLPVVAFGMRTNFLHLPLILLLPNILDGQDVKSMGRWFMILSLPMAMLMAYQFRSSPTSWINKGVGVGEGGQLETAMGKIRPPGTFSFITGAVAYFSIVAAFVGHGITLRKMYPAWLLVVGAASTVLAVSVSGSRSAALSVAIVLAALLFTTTLARKAAAGFTRVIMVGMVVLYIMGQTDYFSEGIEVLETRFQMASNTDVGVTGILDRVWRQFADPMSWMWDVSIMGQGLGVGTNVGAKYLTGSTGFLLAEGEWGRVVLEMGPLFGFAFILWRLALVAAMVRTSYAQALARNALPMLLVSAVAMNTLNGQIAQATILGFVALGGGLVLAAVKVEGPAAEADEVLAGKRQDRLAKLRFANVKKHGDIKPEPAWRRSKFKKV